MKNTVDIRFRSLQTIKIFLLEMDRSPIDFSQSGKVLTVEQREFYDKNGYILIRNCVPRHEIERYV